MLPAKSWTIILRILSLVTVISSGKLRRRRDLLDLADMFDMATGLDPSDYIPYGNWCGYGGQGKPIDLIDACCQVHDDCYGSTERYCSNQIPHIIQYSWKVNNKLITCEEESTCGASVCKCDKDVVECIAQHNHTYSKHHRFVKHPG